MKKNKKIYGKVLGLFLFIFVCFSFFSSSLIATAYWEYQNPDKTKTEICEFADNNEAGCNARVKTACGQTTTGVCVPTTDGCNSSQVAIDCPTVVNITGNKNTNSNGTYTLLAPIGGMKTAPTNFGEYVDKIFLIAIGLCGVLAVIMLIIGGIQYMGDESIFGKTEAKKQMINAVLGLLIALGAWVLLNTINPNLLNSSVSINAVSAEISPTDTSTGSSTSLCLSTTNPPDPQSATGSTLNLNTTITNTYLPALNSISGLSTGVKLLITAQTAVEGFSSGTKSFTTNNPGNIGNTDNGATKSYSTLADGINAQVNIVKNVANGSSPSYKIGSNPTCALGSETYNGSLYQYLRIYATGARTSNAYLNAIIGYFKANGKTITANTKMSEIYNMV